MTLYGISHCETVKQARRWLDAQCIAYAFHDYKRQGLDASQLRAWMDELGWETLLNRRGTTWRKLPEAVRAGMDEEHAFQIMLSSHSIIRRPLLDTGRVRHVGFSATQYQELFR
jgi:Spx/MgsR family transcriptional regulator